jgi:hypothetical protein
MRAAATAGKGAVNVTRVFGFVKLIGVSFAAITGLTLNEP